MNKSEKLIVLVLGLVLAGWIWHSVSEQKKVAEVQAQQAAKAAKEGKDAKVAADSSVSRDSEKPGASESASDSKKEEKTPQPAAPRAPEQLVALTNDQIELTFSSRGAVVVKAKMLQYAEKPGALAENNPPVVFDLSAHPALALGGVQGLAAEDVPAEPAK